MAMPMKRYFEVTGTFPVAQLCFFDQNGMQVSPEATFQQVLDDTGGVQVGNTQIVTLQCLFATHGLLQAQVVGLGAGDVSFVVTVEDDKVRQVVDLHWIILVDGVNMICLHCKAPFTGTQAF
jgi:hypothetical protein